MPATPDRDGRDESPLERLDRNWTDLLQELRVAQTGVELLTGFLLTLPFQSRFDRIDDLQRDLFLITAAAAVLTTVLLQAPVIIHRTLFRRHRRAETVILAHRLTVSGMALLGVAVVCVSGLIADVVLGRAAGAVAGATVLAVVVAAWVALPLRVRRASRIRYGPDPGPRRRAPSPGRPRPG